MYVPSFFGPSIMIRFLPVTAVSFCYFLLLRFTAGAAGRLGGSRRQTSAAFRLLVEALRYRR
jgi:hypothetical protein